MEFHTDGTFFYMGSFVNGIKFGHGITLYEPDLKYYYDGFWKNNLLVKLHKTFCAGLNCTEFASK